MSATDYERLEREHAKARRTRDWSEQWSQLDPLANVNGSTGERVAAFCREKRITLDALKALGTRVKVRRHGEVELAWGYEHRGAVTAVKFRPLGEKKRYALDPSTFVQPLVIGDLSSLDWFVAEGETDGCRLFDLIGEDAAIVVLPAGASTFKQEWAHRIPRGANVYLCHDADKAGDRGAETAAQAIGGKTVRVRPPVEGSDWCEWEGDRVGFVRLVKEARDTHDAGMPGYGAVLVDLRGLEIRDVDWHDDGFLPVGQLAILQGHGGVSKGTLACAWTAELTRARRFVLLIASEDDYETMLKPRLVAAGADLAFLRCIDFRRGNEEDAIRIPDDLAELRRVIEETGAALVVIDPLLTHLAGTVDAYRDHEVKRALRPLAKLANATGCTILGVHHFTKDTSRGARHSGQASAAFGNTARIVLAMAVDPETDLRVLEVVKCNIGPEGLRRAVRVELVHVPGLAKPIPRTTFAGAAERTVDELLALARQTQPRVSREKVQDVILHELTSEPKTRKQLDDACRDELGVSADTVYKSGLEPLKKAGEIKASKDGFKGGWMWSLAKMDNRTTAC